MSTNTHKQRWASTTSSFSLALPMQHTSTPRAEQPQLRPSRAQKPMCMPNPGTKSVSASIAAGSVATRSTMSTAAPDPSIRPLKAMSWSEIPPSPPAPTQPGFPEDAFAATGHAETAQHPMLTASCPKSTTAKAVPYHRTINDAYPHVFRPKPKPVRPSKSKLSRSRSSRAFEATGKFLDGLKKKAQGLAAHRTGLDGKHFRVGMSVPVTGSFHSFHLEAPKADEAVPPEAAPRRKVKVIGHPDRGTMIEDFMNPKIFESSSEETLKASVLPPLAPLPKKQGLRNRYESKLLPDLPSDAFPEAPSTPPIPRKHPGRVPGSLRGQIPQRRSKQEQEVSTAASVPPGIPYGWERLPASHPLPQKKVKHGPDDWMPPTHKDKAIGRPQPRGRGLEHDPDADKSGQGTPTVLPPVWQRLVLDIDPTSPVDWEEIHRGAFPTNRRVLFDPALQTNVEMPRFDEERPAVDELFENVTPEEMVTAWQQEDRERRRRSFEADLLVGEDVAEAVAENDDIPGEQKAWTNEEITRLREFACRGSWGSDPKIIIDTFPHNAHTSWRATERTTDNSVHSSRQRISREAHDDGGGQDAAGLLMKKLSRQMKGL